LQVYRQKLPSNIDQRMLLPEPNRRVRQIDEALLVLQQAPPRLASLLRAARASELLNALPPHLGHAVEVVGRAAVRAHGLAEGRAQRRDLHVTLPPQRWGQLSHEGAVRVEPVALKLLTRQMRQTAGERHAPEHK